MKKLISLVCALVLVFSLAACSADNSKPADNNADKTTSQEEVKWTISVIDADGKEIKLTNVETGKLEAVEMDALQKKKDGSETKQHWSGVKVKDVFNELGITEYSSAVFEASDGYSKEVTADLLTSDDAILGLKLDGEELTEKYAPAELVINGKGSNWWIRNLTKITINK